MNEKMLDLLRINDVIRYLENAKEDIELFEDPKWRGPSVHDLGAMISPAIEEAKRFREDMKHGIIRENNMKPSVGRMVHYVSYGTPGGEYPSVCRAAIVTEVPGFTQDVGVWNLGSKKKVHLCVLNPEGLFFNKYVMQDDENHLGGTWHWPERVEE